MIGKTSVLEDGNRKAAVSEEAEGSTELESDSRRLLPAQPIIIQINT